MKIRTVFNFLMLLAVLLPTGLFAQVVVQSGDICSDKNPVKFLRGQTVQDVLKNYERAGDVRGDTVYLCFGDTAYQIITGTSLTVKEDRLINKIVIFGLDFVSYPDPEKQPQTFALTLTNPITGKTVTLANSKFEGFKDAIKIEDGEGKVELENITIAGDGQGSCATIAAPNSIIKSSNISKCMTGIKILPDAVNVLVEDTDISGSTVGIESAAVGGTTKGVTVVGATSAIKLLSGADNSTIENINISASVTGIETSAAASKIKEVNIAGTSSPIRIQSGANNSIIEHATIEGTGTGTCLAINSDNVIVKSSDISKCATGILLNGANNALLGAEDKEGYLADEWNYIHNNSTGVHLVDSTAKFRFNKIDKNIIVKDNEIMASADNGILIDNGLRPVVMLDDKSGKVLSCHKKTDEGAIEKRELKFKLPSEGDIDLYLSDNNYKQGRDWIASCHAKSEETCVLQDVRLEKYLSDTECGRPDLVVTAIFTDTSSSMYTIEPFTLDGIASIVIVESSGPLGGGQGFSPNDLPGPDFENRTGPDEKKNQTQDTSAAGADSVVSAKMSCSVASGGTLFWYLIFIPFLFTQAFKRLKHYR